MPHTTTTSPPHPLPTHTTTSPLTRRDFHHLLLNRVAVYCHGGGGGGGEGLRLDVLHKEQQHEVDDSKPCIKVAGPSVDVESESDGPYGETSRAEGDKGQPQSWWEGMGRRWIEMCQFWNARVQSLHSQR